MESSGIIKISNNPLRKLMDVIQNALGSHNKDSEIKNVYINGSSEDQLNNRIQKRLDFQESKRQQNLDYINYIAAEQLEQEKDVSEEPVDEDWTTRFFNYAQDISNEEMQRLWGRILAGEIKRPRSFSLRTLEILRNLSKEEAQVFMKFAFINIKSGNTCCILNFKNEKLLEEKYGLTYYDRLLLEELGFITANDLQFKLAKTENTPRKVVFVIGKIVVIQSKLENRPEQHLEVLAFTKIGQQLLNLVDFTPDLDYIQLLATKLSRDNGPIHYGLFLENLPDGRFRHSPLIEVPMTEYELEQKRKQNEQGNNK